ncbi:protease 4 [Salmonella enterica subsp. enterica serovar Soerenga]|nr:protease 4 [Salmonella enterica subsp. enterica serovar Soerenga str. 695]
MGVGIWMQIGNGSNSEQTARGALLLDISGVIVDKPSTNHRLGALGRQLFWRQLRPSAGKLPV